MTGELMAAEIAEQPARLADLLAAGGDDVGAAVAAIRQVAPRAVLLAARGTSDHAALYAKYLIEVVLGLPAGLASPSTMTAYGSRPDLTGMLWLTVSQSGGSPDLVESAQIARSCGALTVAVTNAPDSPLASAAQCHVDVRCGPERAVAATKSYTCQLLALWLLCRRWADLPADPAAALPELAAGLLARDEVPGVAARFRFVDRLVTTGRGYSYPTAREAALKLMETSYLSAHAFSGADLLHGPFAMIDHDRPVVVVAPEGVGGRAMAPVLERLRERAADVTLVGDPVAASWAAATVPLPSGIPEDLSPILSIMPLQQLALAMAVARGNDPDAPRGLRKVTQTW